MDTTPETGTYFRPEQRFLNSGTESLKPLLEKIFPLRKINKGEIINLPYVPYTAQENSGGSDVWRFDGYNGERQAFIARSAKDDHRELTVRQFIEATGIVDTDVLKENPSFELTDAPFYIGAPVKVPRTQGLIEDDWRIVDIDPNTGTIIASKKKEDGDSQLTLQKTLSLSTFSSYNLLQEKSSTNYAVLTKLERLSRSETITPKELEALLERTIKSEELDLSGDPKVYIQHLVDTLKKCSAFSHQSMKKLILGIFQQNGLLATYGESRRKYIRDFSQFGLSDFSAPEIFLSFGGGAIEKDEFGKWKVFLNPAGLDQFADDYQMLTMIEELIHLHQNSGEVKGDSLDHEIEAKEIELELAEALEFDQKRIQYMKDRREEYIMMKKNHV
ncbi:MAG: hypothetical protein ABIO02_02380 [Patescibacteria group bacterium]